VPAGRKTSLGNCPHRQKWLCGGEIVLPVATTSIREHKFAVKLRSAQFVFTYNLYYHTCRYVILFLLPIKPYCCVNHFLMRLYTNSKRGVITRARETRLLLTSTPLREQVSPEYIRIQRIRIRYLIISIQGSRYSLHSYLISVYSYLSVWRTLS
jgi:hypothetical protein